MDTAVLIVTNAYHRTWRQLRLKRQIVGKKSELKSLPVPPLHVSGIAGIYSNSPAASFFFKPEQQMQVLQEERLLSLPTPQMVELGQAGATPEDMYFLAILLYLA